MAFIHNNNDYLKKSYNRFVITLITLNLFIFTSTFESLYNLPHILKYLFSVTVIYNLIVFYNNSSRSKYNSTFIRFFVVFFIVVSLFLLIGSIRLENLFIQELFGERYFFMPFLLPILFLLIRYELLFFKVILRYTYLLVPIAILIQIYSLFFFSPESYIYDFVKIITFSIAPALLLLVSHLYKNKNIGRFTFLYFLLFAILTALWGRRGETIESVFFLLWFFIIRVTSGKTMTTRKIATIISGLIIFVAGFYIVAEKQKKILMFERGLNKEGFENSRGETIENFTYEFGRKPNDYLIGRGLNGTFQKFNSGGGKVARSIEIGYFNILLKGGFLYLIPMLILFISAFIMGFLKSNNDLVKGLSLLVLWQLIYMVSFGMADYSTKYILLWIAVTVCFDPRLRTISNKELIFYFNK